MVRTTIRLDDALLDQARQEAQRRGTTLTTFIEQSMRNELARAKENGSRPKVKLLVSPRKGWVLPGVNINSNAELQAFLDQGVPFEKLR